VALRVDLGGVGLGAVRLTTDAVWETVASLHVLSFPRQHLLHQRLRRLLPRPATPGHDLLVSLTSDKQWFPDLLAPVPRLDPPAPLEQFDRLRDTPYALVERDLEEIRHRLPRSPVARMRADEYADAVSRALAGYWGAVLRPMWDRVEAITQDDIARLSRSFARVGVAAGVDDMHGGLTYADGRLTVDFHQTERTVETGPGGVWLVPSVFRWPWVAAQYEADSLVLSHAARGAAKVWASPDRGEDGAALAALVGRSRAAILQSLDVPRSTTWLGRHLGLSPGTVSDHLSILNDSGLLSSRRDGRRVLYFHTHLGRELANGTSRSWAPAADS
jgi:DNA-binding transcriptional ArsR family regulator